MYTTQYIVLSALLVANAVMCADLMNWHFTAVHKDSFRPSSRDNGVMFTRTNGNIIVGLGYAEQIAINRGANVFFNDMFSLDVNMKWTRIHSGGDWPDVPAPRAFTCAGYHEEQDALYIFGGVNYTATFSAFTYRGDAWVFHFRNNSWTQLSTEGAPSARAGMGCAIKGNAIYMTHGAVPPTGQVPFQVTNELWKWDLLTNTWTQIQSTGGPNPRTQVHFLPVPNTDAIFFTGGESFNLYGKALLYNDIYMYRTSTNTWEQLANTGTPQIIHEFPAMQALSSRYILAQNGDAQGNLTTAETCLPPLICIIQATSTDDTYIYDIQTQRWTFLDVEYKPPPTKRSMMTLRNGVAYMFGGYGWDGLHGVGSIRDTLLKHMNIQNRYLSKSC